MTAGPPQSSGHLGPPRWPQIATLNEPTTVSMAASGISISRDRLFRSCSATGSDRSDKLAHASGPASCRHPHWSLRIDRTDGRPPQTWNERVHTTFVTIVGGAPKGGNRCACSSEPEMSSRGARKLNSARRVVTLFSIRQEQLDLPNPNPGFPRDIALGPIAPRWRARPLPFTIGIERYRPAVPADARGHQRAHPPPRQVADKLRQAVQGSPCRQMTSHGPDLRYRRSANGERPHRSPGASPRPMHLQYIHSRMYVGDRLRQ